MSLAELPRYGNDNLQLVWCGGDLSGGSLTSPLDLTATGSDGSPAKRVKD